VTTLLLFVAKFYKPLCSSCEYSMW